jgi:tripartite-type tricarboxylate transporter receptor subunit TctC
LGFDPAPGTPQQLAAIIKADAERWRKLIQDLNLRRD